MFREKRIIAGKRMMGLIVKFNLYQRNNVAY